MRLLLIDDEARYRALIRHHVTCRWPAAEVVTWNPLKNGPVPPEFLAYGFHAVILDHAWARGDGLAWLRDLAARPRFAPIIYLAATGEAADVAPAQKAGAFAVFGKAKLDHVGFTRAIAAAAAHQLDALARWRGTPEGMDAERFGAVTLRGYRRVRELARGSVSELYLAESEQAGALVALKITREVRNSSGVDQSYERFLQEYEILRRLSHPNVVRIHELGVLDDFAFIVMEYFASGDLRRRMRAGLSADEALAIARDIALVLDAVHSAGVLHRDLKPGNVMMRADGTLALIDFGLAKHEALEMEITDSGLIFGTPHYMSPEQGHGQAVGERSDLYSLGVILFEMLSGTKPFVAENPMAIIYQHAKSPVPPLPASLDVVRPVLEKLLAKDPLDRVATGRAAAAAIEAARVALARLAEPA